MRRAPALLAVLLAATACQAAKPNPNASATPPASPTTTAPPTATSTPTPRPTPKDLGPRTSLFDVVYAAGVSVDDGAAAVANAGGEVVHENAAVGVATVKASTAFFATARKDNRVYGIVPNPANGLPPGSPPNDAVATGGGMDAKDLTSYQWDMKAIHAPDARAVTKGDPRVLVAVIDTGVDGTHPDLRAAFDRDLSRNFVTDVPGMDGPCEVASCVDPVTEDPNGHGTHVAGTIAAADDGRGTTGVAPGVRLVSLRAGQDSGLFLLMPTVDALTYAGDIGVDVANLSYFVDPWLFNCGNGPDDSDAEHYQQRALIEGVRRAVDYAYRHGVTLIGAAGNEHVDLANPTVDTISPDFPDGAKRRRRVSNSCYVLPTELPHVIQVSAVGRDLVKTDYSSYGLGEIVVAAPGGGQILANGDGPATTNLTLSTYPAAKAKALGALDRDGTSRTVSIVSTCASGTCAYYRWFSGTSMASPHAAGVAALIVSRFGTDDPTHPGTLRMDPAEVARILRDTATAKACPSPPRLTYPRRPPGYAATCRGTATRNGFYGDGIVDALAAVRAS